MEDLRKVAKPTKDNWKLWVTIGNDLIDEYEEILGLSEPEIDDTGYRDKIRDSIISVKDMFALLEAESAFKKRQKRKDLDNRWNYWKKVILRAYKDVPGPAKDAYKNIIRRRDKIYFAATDSSDPALGGSSGFDSGTKSTGTFTGNADDVEQDAIKTDLENLPGQSGMGMQSQIDTSNRVSKDQKNRDGYLERIKNVVYVLDKNNLKKAISKGRAEVEDFLLTDRLPTKDIRKYTSKYYSLVAEKFGLQGLLFKGNIYFTDGSKEQADPNDETHKKIAQAQYELGALDNRDADKYVDMYGLNDLPKDSGMSQQTRAAQGLKRDEVEWNGKPVPALNKYNWKQWIELGNGLLTRYVAFKDKSGNESVQYKNKSTIAESIRLYLNTLVEKTEMSDQDKANWELLQQQFAKVKKELPPEALKAYRDLELKKRDYDISGIDSGPFDDNRDFGKDRYDAEQKETYGDFYDIVQSVLKNTNLQTIQAAEQKIEKMNKEFRNLPVLHSTMKAQMYGSIAKRLGWKGIFNLDGKTVTFAETTPRKPNFFGDLSDMDKRLFMNGEHVTKDVAAVEKDADMQKIAYKQFRLGFLPNAVIPKFINKLNSADPNSEEKTATGGALPKVTLKGKMHLNKELPPLSSKTVEDYKKVYRKILRRYTAGTGKGRSYSKVPESSSANSIRQILNILSEAGAKMSSADLEDLTAIENAFKAAEKRKLITPQEVADFAPLISSKEQLTNQLKYDPKKQGNVPDTLKKAMAIKAPGSDTNYGVFNDQVMAVLNNPTPENLIKQAEAVSAMDLDGIDTDRMKFSAFYGHVANAMGLSGMITHRNSFMNSPMVVSAKARKTDFSDKMPEMLPFGEYSVEAVDFDNPRHKAVAQAQLNKNLLPASIQMSQNNTIDDVYKRFGITKQEPQEPEKTDDVSPTVKSGIRTKPSDLGPSGIEDRPANTAAEPAAAEPAAAEPAAAGPKPGAPRNKYHYKQFVPLPKLYNKMLRLPASLDLFVDRVPRKADGLLGQQLSITDSPETGKGIEVIHKNYKGKVYNKILGWLQQQNLSLISKAEADRYKDDADFGKSLERPTDDNFPDRVGGPGDNAYQMGTAGKDKDLALARNPDPNKRPKQTTPKNKDWTGDPDSSASFPPEENLPTASDTWGTDTSDGYQGTERPAPDAEERPTNTSTAPDKPQGVSMQGGDGGNTLGKRRFIAVPYTGPYQQTPNDYVIKDRKNPKYKSSIYPNRERAERAAAGMEKIPSAYPTASDGAPAEVDPLQQQPNPASIEDNPPTGDVPERYKIQQETDSSGKTVWKVYDSQNALGVSQIVDTEDEAKKVAAQLNKLAAQNPVKDQGEFPVRQQNGKIAASPERPNKKLDMDKIAAGLPSTAKDDYNKWARDQQAKKEKDQKNDNTDFTRLLKNAGLLKEFY